VKKKHIGIPVISIGNLELGGTGKTPLTIETGKILQELSIKTVILSYAKNKKSIDEPIQIASALSGVRVISGKHKRSLLSEIARNNNDLIVIIDDGFQYFDIKKKIDLVLINPETPVKFLIPAGRMRFPFSFLRYADAVFVNETVPRTTNKYKKTINRIKEFRKPVFSINYVSTHLVNIKGEKYPLSTVTNKRILGICGIARPKGFINMIQKLNPESVYMAIYPDHFEYDEVDVLELQDIFTRLKFDIAITTEKDLAKLRRLKIKFPVQALSVKIDIDNSEFFRNWLIEKTQMILDKNL